MKMLPMKKGPSFRLLAALAAFGVAASFVPSASAFGVSVDINAGPPPPRHEEMHMRDRPSPDYVWIQGYWAGEPGHYEWTAGHWDRPPHHGAVWVAPRWDHRNGHAVFVRGFWR
jgi:hypothetical protein